MEKWLGSSWWNWLLWWTRGGSFAVHATPGTASAVSFVVRWRRCRKYYSRASLWAVATLQHWAADDVISWGRMKLGKLFSGRGRHCPPGEDTARSKWQKADGETDRQKLGPSFSDPRTILNRCNHFLCSQMPDLTKKTTWPEGLALTFKENSTIFLKKAPISF